MSCYELRMSIINERRFISEKENFQSFVCSGAGAEF